MADKLDCALDLMRRLPPADVEDNLAGLIDLAPDLTEDLLSAVDQPLKIANDKTANRDYLLCDYNRDGEKKSKAAANTAEEYNVFFKVGAFEQLLTQNCTADSYRSPWSSKYDPPLPDGAQPSATLRKLEVQMNEVFDIYRDLYYEGGVSSVYCWDLDGGNFAACILIKKTQDQSKKGQPMKGTWDSIHVVEIADNKSSANYTLTSTVMLSLETKNDNTGKVHLAGSLTRREEKEHPVSTAQPHVVNIGRMIEDMEIKLRTVMETIYFGKTKEVANTLRSALSKAELDQRKQFSNEINRAVKK